MNQSVPPFLELEGISFSYRSEPVLRNLQWRWDSGQQWACVGPNGAGKTTLAALISGQLQHPSGHIRRHRDLNEAGVAYVCFEQQRTLCDRDRRLDDSEFRSDASDVGTTVRRAILGRNNSHPAFDQWVERLKLEHILDRGLRFISTGEMRKTLLLRAILSEPALLILDSPLDGLDRSSQEEMTSALEQLLQSPLRLLLLCRDLDDIPAGISHLLVLDGGDVLAAGPAGELCRDDGVVGLMKPDAPKLGQLPAPYSRPYQVDPDCPLLELRGVSVSYGETTIFKDVDWTLERGQHCAISGPNGSGKTTLLSLVDGDNHKAYGQDITLFGRKRGSGESVWDIKQKFGLLNTQLHLNQVRGMRVLEVVISGFFDSLGLYQDWGDAQRQAARNWLAALGMEDWDRIPFDTLSFGAQRMVMLARAMVKSPLVLVLDEPCLGLDAYHRDIILRSVDHIAAQSDTQVLFVSHSAGEAPDCINQWLSFVPGPSGFRVEVR